MIKTALRLVKALRRLRRGIVEIESEGLDASALRRVFHMSTLVLRDVLAGEIAEETVVPLLELLDKFRPGGKMGERADASGQRAKGQWITVNGTHVLLDKSGAIVSGPRNLMGRPASAVQPKGKNGTKSTAPGGGASATGRNKPCTGFKNRAAEKSHKKHWEEFGVKSNAEYVSHANRLFIQPVGGKIAGYGRPDGTIVRYHMETGGYVAGTPGGTINTYFKPRFSKGKVNLTTAYEYFERHRKEEGGE